MTFLRWFQASLGLSLSLSLGTAGCSDPASASPTGGAQASAVASALEAKGPPTDVDGEACLARAKAALEAPELPGSPAYEANRVGIMGRARGEPMLFVREPAPVSESGLTPSLLASKRAFDRGRPGSRVYELLKRHKTDPRALRSLLLREGYAFFTDPADALALVTAIHMSDIFDEPEAWIQRGADVRRLRREVRGKETAYRYVDGPSVGRAADLLFGDRVALREEDLASPLHRDLRGLADDLGFDRAKIARRTEGVIVADLRFGQRWARSVVNAKGAALSLDCVAEPKEVRDDVARLREASAPRRRALQKIHEVITSQVTAALRFDRPEGEKTADRDGFLRPVWATAYFQGRPSFTFEKATFPVYDEGGKPWPPQVCVDFVLDTFERASGTWFSPRGEAPARLHGSVDFDKEGIENRRGVMAFGTFAEKTPELFETRRFQGAERIQFGERERFFGYLTENADEVRMGDVVAIHGLKRDDRIHQHAIFVEWTDPITGFPYGLADQMKKPRRRTWEGIMAEAPKRSLYYRVRPTETLIARVGG